MSTANGCGSSRHTACGRPVLIILAFPIAIVFTFHATDPSAGGVAHCRYGALSASLSESPLVVFIGYSRLLALQPLLPILASNAWLV